MTRSALRLQGWQLLGTTLATATAFSMLPLAARASDGDHDFEATHRQVAKIDITHDGQPALMQTFCVDPQGNLLVACGGKKVVRAVTSAGRTTKNVEQPAEIRIYSPRGEFVSAWPLAFMPDTVNVGPDGSVWVAGAGKIQRLDREGRVVLEGKSPLAHDMSELMESVRKQQEKQYEQIRERYSKMIADLDKQIAGLEGTDGAARDPKLRTLQSRKQAYERTLTTFKQRAVNPEVVLKSKLRMPGIAIADQDVFIACSSTSGAGYDVWRLSRELGEAKRIVSGMRGCCGQMDIQTQNGELWVAENARHRVCRYDRDGKLLNAFGSKARSGIEGFEGCCNPMNLRFCGDGEVLTAESGGRIKRYSPEGKLLGLVGNASIKPGCKHSAIAADKDFRHVYMVDITQSQIAVLERIDAKAAPATTTKRRVRV